MIRRFRAAALTLAALSLAGPAHAAENYPVRPVRLVVGFPAGGPTDVLARLIAQKLSERLGQQFVIENKPGAGSNIATEAALNAPPDGYTILVCASANTINSTLYKKLPFDFARDSAAVAGLARVPNALLLHPSVPATSVAAFVAHAKANPGKINMASSGSGTTVHLAGELFKAMTGVELVHVPYRGSAPAITALVAGQVEVMFGDVTSAISHIRSGAVRALAITTASRIALLPDLPPIADTVPGYEASAWFGFVAPRGTPADIVAKLNGAINAALDDPGIKTRFAALAATPMRFAPGEFATFIGEETAKWAQAVKLSGATVE
jgi:tripartite-type tricarboxylate transporter receptor subunit TctC